MAILTEGALAFDFEIKDIHGKLHRYADYKGKWLLMVFHRHLG